MNNKIVKSTGKLGIKEDLKDLTEELVSAAKDNVCCRQWQSLE